MKLITPTITDIVVNDCGYGFSAYAVLSDGTQAFHTKELKPTAEDAKKDVASAIDRIGHYTGELTFHLTSEF